jgi:hypothetical protein
MIMKARHLDRMAQAFPNGRTAAKEVREEGRK